MTKNVVHDVDTRERSNSSICEITSYDTQRKHKRKVFHFALLFEFEEKLLKVSNSLADHGKLY